MEMWNCWKYFVGMGNNLSLPADRSCFRAFLSCDKSENPKFPQRKDVILYAGFRLQPYCSAAEEKELDM